MLAYHTFRQDSYAGFMVALLLIPQAIAYAMAAGVPPAYGLYASIFPLIVYSLAGSSPLLSVGPVAVISIMVFTGLSPIAAPGSALFLSLVAMLTLMTGLLQMAFAVMRLGRLFQSIPPSVLRGFMNALALTIILNQIGPFLGISFQKELPFVPALGDLVHKLPHAEWPVLLFSFVLLGLYYFLRAVRVPSPSLVVVLVSGLAVYFFHLENVGVQLAGPVTSGLPTWEIPTLLLPYVPTLLPLAFFIAVIGFLESFTMATHLPQQQEKKVDPNQELFALGLANCTGSFVNAIPVAGAFSRSAVNKDAGAKTRVSSLFSASCVLFLSMFFAEPLAYLPRAVLAIIIMVAAAKLIDWPSIGKKPLVFITTAASLLLGLQSGFIIGLGAALLSYILVMLGNSKPTFRR
ncbi:SulP family inorganic anion transporter [Bacillus piscicola]|uniref:SulP family inorganic anion transporter n=1 Tax=Bacillus piscicola TaxID=1632684 RepID=UPI001F09F115